MPKISTACPQNIRSEPEVSPPDPARTEICSSSPRQGGVARKRDGLPVQNRCRKIMARDLFIEVICTSQDKIQSKILIVGPGIIEFTANTRAVLAVCADHPD